jgi:hypothetical protein
VGGKEEENNQLIDFIALILLHKGTTSARKAGNDSLDPTR